MTLARWSFGLFVFEFAGGWFANSLALMSDAFHVLFDGMENILSVFVARMSRESERNEERIRAMEKERPKRQSAKAAQTGTAQTGTADGKEKA